MKESKKSLEWLDLSRNKFHQEPKVIAAICAGLKNQKDLYFLGMDTSMRPGYTVEEIPSFQNSERITVLLLVSMKLNSPYLRSKILN